MDYDNRITTLEVRMDAVIDKLADLGRSSERLVQEMREHNAAERERTTRLVTELREWTEQSLARQSTRTEQLVDELRARNERELAHQRDLNERSLDRLRETSQHDRTEMRQSLERLEDRMDARMKDEMTEMRRELRTSTRWIIGLSLTLLALNAALWLRMLGLY